MILQGITEIIVDWPTLKTLINAEKTNFVYDETVTRIEVAVISNPAVYKTILWKDLTVVLNPSQYNNTWLDDFNTNYKPYMNFAVATTNVPIAINPDGTPQLASFIPINRQLPSTLSPLGNLTVAIREDIQGNILRVNEFSITSKTETDVANTSYTVPSGKNFFLNFWGASLESNVGAKFRLKVNNITKFCLVLYSNTSNKNEVPSTIKIATAGDIIKMTCESNISKGSAWCGYSGVEI